MGTTSPVTGHWALNDDQDHAIVNGGGQLQLVC